MLWKVGPVQAWPGRCPRGICVEALRYHQHTPHSSHIFWMFGVVAKSESARAEMELFAAATIEKLAKRIRPSLTKPNKRFANARARGAKQRERYSKV